MKTYAINPKTNKNLHFSQKSANYTRNRLKTAAQPINLIANISLNLISVCSQNIDSNIRQFPAVLSNYHHTLPISTISAIPTNFQLI